MRSISSRSMPTPAPSLHRLTRARRSASPWRDRPRSRCRAPTQVDLFQLRLRPRKSALGARHQRFGEAQGGGAVDEAADRRAAERGDGVLEAGVSRSRGAGVVGQPAQGGGEPVADRDSLPLAATTRGLSPSSSLRIEKPLALPVTAVTPAIRALRSRCRDWRASSAASLDLRGQHEGAAELLSLTPSANTAPSAKEAAMLLEVDPDLLQGALQFAWPDIPGMPFRVEAVDRFFELLAEAGEGEGGERVGRQRAEQLGDVSGGRFLAAQVAAEVDLDLVGAGITLATAVASLGSMPALSQQLARLGVDLVAPTARSGRRRRRRRRRGCRLGGRRDRARRRVFVGERVAVRGVDRGLEGPLARR